MWKDLGSLQPAVKNAIISAYLNPRFFLPNQSLFSEYLFKLINRRIKNHVNSKTFIYPWDIYSHPYGSEGQTDKVADQICGCCKL